MGKRHSSINVFLGKLDSEQYCAKRMKMDRFLTPYTKVNSKWIKNLNARHETIIFLEENIGKALMNINRINFFLDTSLWAGETEVKINKWEYIKLQSFSAPQRKLSAK